MNYLIYISTKLYQSKIAFVIRHTLQAMFPIILVGSFAAVLRYAFFSPSGYISTIINLKQWFPFYTSISHLTSIIYECTINIVALYAAYFSTQYTLSAYHKQIPSGGMIGLMAYLIISYQQSENGHFSLNTYLVSHGMLLGILTGYLVGMLLRGGVNDQKHNLTQLIILVMLTGIIATLINVLFKFLTWLSLPTYIAEYVTGSTDAKAFWYVVGSGILTDLMAIFAMGGPFINSPTFIDAPSWTNLMHALKTGSPWNAPFKFTDTTLFHSFANFGGSGCVLALIIAILLFSTRERYRNISKWSLFPTIFNNNYALMFGIPLLYNPIFIVPFILCPLVNMLIAGGLLGLNLIPVAVYPVPAGTPAPLIALIGTNGNWGVFILSLILIMIDTIIYYPFIKVSERIINEAGEKNEK